MENKKFLKIEFHVTPEDRRNNEVSCTIFEDEEDWNEWNMRKAEGDQIIQQALKNEI